MNKNIWIILAITFFVIASLETVFIVWSLTEYNQQVENEKECALEVCDNSMTYYYDNIYEVCYCYIDHEIVKTLVMG